ncbi:N-acetylmannosamine-6-phosphate 2-epimerase [Mangrovicella endophytica]|uniref:N-acetylmannosamine-6-phosphate 2-epimerase n=1 Tax=Mangrovicella endophytica TaxID=2066697 RepID=UPI000C9E1DD1|nr:N-acetylmannosamine-6-phosphate 2-epimerase [Mangrovicella endophytica]
MTLSRLTDLSGTLVVSCQAEPGLPLDAPEHIVALARSAVIGGAAGLRIQGVDNIRAVRAASGLPLIGLLKVVRLGTDIYITPSIADIDAVVDAGADIIAFDATDRPRPDTVQTLCERVRRAGRLSMADISTVEEGQHAIDAGADIVSTTMSGYTPYSRQLAGPDFALMSELAAAGVPFAAEGRIWSGEEARRALDLGARFVVVGSAITRPDMITRRFVDEALHNRTQKLKGHAAE